MRMSVIAHPDRPSASGLTLGESYREGILPSTTALMPRMHRTDCVLPACNNSAGSIKKLDIHVSGMREMMAEGAANRPGDIDRIVRLEGSRAGDRAALAYGERHYRPGLRARGAPCRSQREAQGASAANDNWK